MEGRTHLKLIIEKGPREGETLKYSSASLIKIGRVVRGNTIAIKDSGISSKHMSIQFNTQLTKWTLCDLDSFNGTVLNGEILKPYLPSVLNDGDRIKIGELTSIVVKFEAEAEVESNVRPKRNPRRQGISEPDSVVENEKLGLGFGGDLGKNEVKEPVKKRNLPSSGKKAVDLSNEVETMSSRRILRSSKKEDVSFVPTLNQIPEKLNADGAEIVDVSVPVECRMTRGRKKKMVEQLLVDPDLDPRKPANAVVPVVGRVTRGRRKRLLKEPLENAQSSGLEDNLNKAKESLQVDGLEKVKDSGLGENLDTNNESAQENVVSTQECCDGKHIMADERSLKGKEVAEGSGCVKVGCINVQGMELEQMTLEDFFDYLAVQLPKEIYEKSEKIIADLEVKARKYHEFRLQRNESGKGKA